ncbi:MAG: cellulase family glycosylhydrolase [Planctomycetes bacterium]|nr:cellulase family glycosylhydrolase [Planctomycetota bacterium]
MTKFLTSLCLLVAALSSVSSGGLLRAQQTETIDDRFRNVRGINFISTHPSVATYVTSQMPGNYSDVASCVAMWRAYDTTPNASSRNEVIAQLERIKDYGFNTVRVWLSFQYYRNDPAAMASKFDDFLFQCQFLGLHVIPILWDNDFFDPDPSSVPGANEQNYRSWVRSLPAQEEEYQKNLVAEGEEAMTDLNEQYVSSMLAVADPYSQPTSSAPTVILWDIMNEPQVLGPIAAFHAQFMRETMALIKSTNASAKTCISFAGYWNYVDPNEIMLAADPHLDVMGFNFYGYGKRDIERRCDNIKAICNGLSIPVKPILVTEAGLVDSGITYPETINLCANVPASFTGHPTNADGVGFCLYSANVGNKPIMYPGSNFPVQSSGDGLFYGPTYDGMNPQTIFVRDYAPAKNNVGIQLGTLMEMDKLLKLHIPSTPTPVPHSFTYVQADSNPMNTVHALFYVPMINLADGQNRSDMTTILTEAANQGGSSGWSTQDPEKVRQELHVAAQIGAWSFSKDFAYHLSAGSPLVPANVLGEMANRADLMRQELVDNPAWASNPEFLSSYNYVFQNAINYWNLGGYDSWY